jgi:methionyl-tRNA formyltransferase
MKVLFMTGGARESTLRFLLENGVEVIGVATPFSSERNRRFMGVVEVALEFGVPIFAIEKRQVGETVEALSPDVLVSCGFSYLIGRDVIDGVRFAINVHPTLLPKYRGYRSGPYIIINGEDKTGVTIHFMDEGMDTGDIILQREISLSLFDTPRSMHRKLQAVEGEVLFEALQMLISGQYERMKQDESQATEYKQLRTPKDSIIDWERPLKDLYNEIRACDPDDYPAYFYVDGQKVCIRLWRPEKEDRESDMI